MILLVVYALCGLGIGLVSGLIGIGGGTLLVPLFVYAFKMSMTKAVGTSLAVIGPVSIVGAISHNMKGNVELAPVLLIAVCAAVGIFFSGQLINLVPETLLKRAFAVFLIFVAVKMLMK